MFFRGQNLFVLYNPQAILVYIFDLFTLYLSRKRYNGRDMISVRSHPVVFFEDALPSVFHQSPVQFLYYLERDGNKFLNFYWEQVAKNFAESDRVDPYGLNYVIRLPQKDVTIAMVIMPAPQNNGEAHLEAFVYRPRRVTPILRINDMTGVFALVKAPDISGNPKTRIIERTRKGESIERGEGPPPTTDEFYRVVIELIKDSSGNL